MPPRKKDPTGPVPVEAFKHDDKRVNNPTADSGELMSPDVAQPKQLRYPRNPDLDPQLVWAGKDEQDGEDLVVDAPPIYIQEKIVPQVIIENLRKVVEKPELTLFDDFDGLEGYEAVEYYKHEANWSNRMILGRLAPGDGLPRGEGEPAGEGSDGLHRPSVRNQVRVELADYGPTSGTCETAKPKTSPAKSSRSRRSAIPGSLG